MASVCEILLVVILVVVLITAYFMVVRRTGSSATPTCAMSAVPAMAPAQADPISVDEPFSTVERSTRVHQSGASADEGFAPAAVSIGPSVGADDALTPFDEAPEGVASTMWPATAEHASDEPSNAITGADVSAANSMPNPQLTTAYEPRLGNKLGTTGLMSTIADLTGTQADGPIQTGTAGVLNQPPWGAMPDDVDRSAMTGAASMAYRTMGQTGTTNLQY